MNYPIYTVMSITPRFVFIVDWANLFHTRSVTNCAETVTSEVAMQYPGKRIVYRDTARQWSELVHTDGVFERFAPFAATDVFKPSPAKHKG